MTDLYVLCCLNETNFVHKGKCWFADTMWDHFPTKLEILDHSCLKSSDPNDVVMAEALVNSKGAPHRFIYKNRPAYEVFFECMIVKKELGESLHLSEYFHTGYADMDKSTMIPYIVQDPRNIK